MNPHWRTILLLAVVAFSPDALAAPHPEDRIPVDGRVVDEAGQPLAGARVEIRPVVSSYEEGVREVEGKGEPAPAASTVSGADGRFALAAPAAGMWAVIVRADGRVPLRRVSPLLEAVTLPDAAPVRDAGFRVRVVDAQGRPLAGARVRAAVTRGYELFWEPLPRRAVTRADGEALLAHATGETLQVWAAANGHAVAASPETLGAAVTVRLHDATPRQAEIHAAGSGAIVRDGRSGLVLGRLLPGDTALSLAAGAGTRIRIETADGRRVSLPAASGAFSLPPPAARGGRVTGLFGRERRPLAGAWIWPHAEPALAVRSDARGGYQIEGSDLDTGLEAAADGFLPDWIKKVPAAPRDLPAFGLTPASSLAGTVVDEAGQPVAGALIALSCLRPGQAWTSAAGTFRVSGFGGDACRAKVHHPDFAPLVATVEGLPRAVSGVRIVLHPGAAVTGLLVDEHGEPATSHGAVEVELKRLAGAESIGRALVDASGRFRLTHLPAVPAVLLFWRAGARPFIRPGVQIPAAGTADLGRLIFPAGKTLTVRVIDPAGKPLAGAEVWIAAHRGEPALVTGVDGVVTLGGLDPRQDAEVEVCRPGSMPEALRVTTVPAGRLDVPLRPAAALAGTVVDADGAPVAGALVVANRHGTPFVRWEYCTEGDSQTTDGEGRFTITPLKPGWFSVEAEQGPLARTTLKAVEVPVEGRSDLSISLPRSTPFAITGRVTDSMGAPVSAAEVAASAVHGSTLTDADGRYRLEGVMKRERRANSGRVFVSSDLGHDFMRAEKEVKITAGENGVDFVLAHKIAEPAPTASGWVPAEDGGPAVGAEVTGSLRGLDSGEVAWAWIMATGGSGTPRAVHGLAAGDGSYRLGPLTPGTWTLHAMAGHRSAERTIEVRTEDRQVIVDLDFPPEGTQP